MAIRVLKTSFEASHEDIDRLFACNRVSALIWNKTLEIAKSYSLDNNGLFLCITYSDGSDVPQYNDFTATAGVDLGEIHSIAACSTNGNSVIITGRKLRSIHRLRNKQLRSISKAQAKCTKGSLRWKKLQRKKRYVLSKSKHQVAYKTHEITKNFVDWCVENNIGKVYCGDPEGVQRNTSGRKKKNRTQNKKKIRKHKVAQKLSNWNFGKIKDYLKYKLANVGIEFEVINEAYSSQTCPVCGQRHKTSSRNYKCKCGYKAHRDVHGAHNILSLGLNGHFEKVCDFEKQKPKYLRLAA